ncbi:hypothetical protein HanIR_Chr13g0659141 [Helianthus annuus]|nr:hypothetical protein HanIR_Chr13g0659141 [Helianthus annuus]
MATVPPKPLHNFSLPFLKWGQFRRPHRHRNSPATDSSDLNRIHNITKQKPDKQNHKNDVVSPEKANCSNGKIIDGDVVTTDDGDVKPWNLRPRRLVIDSVDGNSNGNGSVKSGRLLRGGGGGAAEEENEEYGKKRRLWISLSKDEIEEDVYAFTGSRPVRRPKKRNRTAQKHVDNVFPGLYLVGVSADSYRV